MDSILLFIRLRYNGMLITLEGMCFLRKFRSSGRENCIENYAMERVFKYLFRIRSGTDGNGGKTTSIWPGVEPFGCMRTPIKRNPYFQLRAN